MVEQQPSASQPGAEHARMAGRPAQQMAAEAHGAGRPHIASASRREDAPKPRVAAAFGTAGGAAIVFHDLASI